jgi:carbamate kinase
MRLVIAIGGDALLEREQRPEAAIQRANAVKAVEALVPLAAQHDVVVTHANGLQVGLLASESAADPHLDVPYPLDVLGAQTQGMIGYWLLQALQNALPGREIASVVDQTLVSAADTAFASPNKLVGPAYDEATARRMSAMSGWTVVPEGPHWRRLVPAPQPQRVVETRLLRRLLTSGVVVVCAGGGGVPVIRNEEGDLEGVEAVIDMDLATAVLAVSLEADALLLTGLPHVVRGHGTPAAEPIQRATPAALRLEKFPVESVSKVEAACRFVEATGKIAAIGSVCDVARLLQGEAGTIVAPSGQHGGSLDLPPPSHWTGP